LRLRSGPVRRFFPSPTSARAPRAPAPIAHSAPAAAAHPSTPSNAPAPAYRQHFHGIEAPRVDGTAFRQAWLVQTRLWSLFETGRINREAVDAALAWRRLAELVSPTKVQRWDVHVDVSTGPGDGGMGLRIDAAAKLRAVAEVLGAYRVAILEACVLNDRPWLELARLLRVSDKTARERAVEAITALAAWKRGDPVPPPPELRPRIQPGSW
jgi:hypothetical protein